MLLFCLVELFDRLNAIPRLDVDEELALIRRAKAGDVGARGRVLSANLRVICMVVMRYRSRLVGRIDDAIALGTEGLVKALAAFDAERGVRFSSYAYTRVRRSITRHLFFQDDVVRRPEGALREGRASRGRLDVWLNAPINADGQTGLDFAGVGCTVAGGSCPRGDRTTRTRADVWRDRFPSTRRAHALRPERIDHVGKSQVTTYEIARDLHIVGGISRQRVQQLLATERSPGLA